MAAEELSIYTTELGPAQVRLLQLKPESQPDDIQCNLQTFNLHDTARPKYFTFSYVWGQSIFSEPITVNNQRIFVTPNLHELLRGLHSRDLAITAEMRAGNNGSLWFWVDAICINQRDLTERGRQVQLMREIYTKTWFTLAWLGPGDDDPDGKAISMIKKLANALYDKTRDEVLHKLLWDEAQRENWVALDRFMRKAWWQRVWIRQECILPEKYILVHGTHFCNNGDVSGIALCLDQGLSNYGNTLQNIKNAPNWIITTHEGESSWVAGAPGFESVKSLHNVRYYRRTHEGVPLLKVLWELRGTLSTDERDQLYGLAGVATDAHELLGIPNYAAPAVDVLAGLVRNYMEHYGNLDIICMAVKPRDDPTWPSWLPDLFRRRRYDNNLADIRVYHLFHLHMKSPPTDKKAPALYNASGDMRPRVTFTAKAMDAYGIILDTIDGLNWAHNDEHDVFDLVQSTSAHNTSVDTNTSIDTMTDEIREMLWRVVAGDRIQEQLPSPSLRRAFEAMCAGILAGDECWYGISDAIKNGRSLLIRGRSLEEWMSATDPKASRQSAQEYAPNGSLACRYLLDSSAVHFFFRKRIMTTEKGHIGLASHYAQKGDVICVLFGCTLPVVLRKCGDEYRFIGEGYLHGFMDGEAVAEMEAGTRQEERFVIR